MRKLTVIVESAPNNYAAYFKDVDGIGVTGDTISEIREKMQGVIEDYVQTCKEYGLEVPDEFIGDYELEFKMDLKTFLNMYSGIFSKAGLERLTGINQKQLWHYAKGNVKPRKKQVERIQDSIHRLAADMAQTDF